MVRLVWNRNITITFSPHCPTSLYICQHSVFLNCLFVVSIILDDLFITFFIVAFIVSEYFPNLSSNIFNWSELQWSKVLVSSFVSVIVRYMSLRVCNSRKRKLWSDLPRIPNYTEIHQFTTIRCTYNMAKTNPR